MEPASEWLEELAGVEIPEDIAVVPGREGQPTLKVGGVYLHSRYRPWEEAARFIDSAGLDVKRPVLVIGAGLGYHVAELVKRGATVAVVEAEPAVAKLALGGPLRDTKALLGVGDPDSIASTSAFREFCARLPQTLIHPPSAQARPVFAERMAVLAGQAALGGRRLSVAVVGPLYGGSLPIAGYLERAFRGLGHRTLYVDAAAAWPFYDVVTKTVKTKKVSAQLSEMLVNVVAEWCYARVVEFGADVCVVMAQAPVGHSFPPRLAKEGIVTAYWFIENWRHMPYWRDVAPRYDTFFHIQPGEFDTALNEVGCAHHAYVPTACDPAIHAPVELTPEEQGEFGCDISFAGAGYPNRNQVLAGLTDYRLKIWGVDWTARELFASLCRPDQRFTPELFARIVAGSKINLNLHASTTHPGVDPNADAINPRVFEIAACGGFQLCDPCRGLDALFDFDTELPVYRNLAELRERVEYFLNRPEERAAIARRARERVLRDHTYEQRAQQMLDLIIERHGGRILKKGVCVQRTVSETAEHVGRDSELGRYLAKLPPDMPFTLDELSKQLPVARAKRGQPEAVFTYLREVHNVTQTLLAARE